MTRLLTLLRWILLTPLVLLALTLAVANRGYVTLSLDPFNAVDPALGFDLPLAIIILLAMFAGILIGGFAAWGQARRKQARRTNPVPPPPSAKVTPGHDQGLLLPPKS